MKFKHEFKTNFSESLNKTNKRKRQYEFSVEVTELQASNKKQKHKYNSQNDKSLIDQTDTRKNRDFLKE